MLPRTDGPDAGYQAAAAALGARDGDPYRAAREAGRAAFAARGWPKRTDEAWRYLSLGEFLRLDFAAHPAVTDADAYGPALQAALTALSSHDEPRVVFADGVWVPGLSDLKGLKGVAVARAPALAGEGAKADGADNPLRAVNHALLGDALAVTVARQALPAQPLHVIHVSAGAEALWAAPHLSVRLEEGAQLTLIESFHAAPGQNGTKAAPRALTAVTAVDLAANALMDHVRWQAADAEGAYVFTDTEARLATAATWRHWAFDVGARLARHNVAAAILGPGADARLGGLSLVDGARQVDHHTIIDHRVGEATSWQFYKSVVDGAGRAIFNGKVKIRQDAQKTEAHQLSKNLMLSAEAEVNAKPELEIDADDVKCSHGTTVAQVSEQEIFYLRSRGIRRADAVMLLSQAFANEVLLKVEGAALARRLAALCEARFRALGAPQGA